MTRHFINTTFRRRTDPKYSGRSASYLRTSGIVDDLRTETETDGLSLKHQHVFFGVHFQCYLGLTETLPLL